MTMFTRRCSRQLSTWRSEFASGFKIFLSLVLLTSFFIPAKVSAQINIDGLSTEWSNYCSSHVQDAYGSGTVDDQFTEGSKDFLFAADWIWAIGQTKAKNDIANGAAVIVNAIDTNGVAFIGSGGPYLAFAGDRTSNNGDAQIGFWFFQNGTAPVIQGDGTHNFEPPKTDGDLLVLADFTGGGRAANVTVLEWVSDGTGTFPNSNGMFNLVTIGAAVAENNAGTTPVPSCWDFSKIGTSYAQNEFYEGFVDLGTFGPGAACFSRFMLETRSSQSITASLDDFVGGPLGGRPTVTVNSPSRCANGPCVQVTATPVPAGTYTYVWTVPQGASNPGNVASFCATVAGEYCVTVTNANGCNSNPGCGTVTVNAAPTAAAGPDQAKCQTPPSGPTSFTLAGTGTNGTVSWAQVGSTGTASASITTPSSLTSNVNVSGIGTVTLRLSVASTNGCGTATDEVVLTVNANPTANAGPDQAKCQTKPSGPTAFTLAASASNGTTSWSQVGATGTANSDITSGTALNGTVNVSGIGTVTLRLTTTSANCGVATDEVVLTVNPNPTANAGPDDSKCQTPPSGPTCFTLAASASNGTTSWAQVGSTGGANSNITSGTALNGTVCVTGIGSVTLRLTTTSANCGVATDEVTLTVTSNPTANAGNDATQCRNAGAQPNTFGTNTFNLSGSGSNGTCSWAVAPGGNPQGYTIVFGNAALCVTTVDISGAVNGGTVTLRLTVSSASCGSATDDVVLTLTALPIIYEVVGTDFCPNTAPNSGTITLSGSEVGVSYQLRKDGLPEQAPQLGTGSPLVWTGLGAGTYDVVGTRIGTSCSTTSGPDDIQENPVPVPTVQNLTLCEEGSTGKATFDLDNGVTNAGGGTISFHTSQADAIADVNPIANKDAYTAATGTTIWVRSENANGCFSVRSFTLTVTDNPDVTAQNLSSCEEGSTGSATFDLDNGVTNADGGTITFHTTQADANTGANPIAGKDAYSAPIGTTTIYVRSANGSCFGTTSFTITVNDNPDVTANNAEICSGDQINLNTLITDADGGTITFHASQADANSGANPIAQPVSPGSTTTYYVRSTSGDCFGTTTITITVNQCGFVLCTYTQGYYGNLGGLSCNGEPADPGPNQFTTLQTITNALNAWGGTLTVGCPGHSVSITLGNEQCVVDKLPGGGAPKALPAGDINICNLTSAYLKNGVINNALLAQTITLGLNMGVDGDLGDFALEANKWLVTADVTECGSEIVKDCKFSCVDNLDGTFTWAVTYTPYHVSSCKISQALYDALTTKDVAGLYALANSALCGTALPAGVSYSDISNAEDCINNAFDGCRFFITWSGSEVAPTAASFCDLPSNTTPCGSRTLARPTTESVVSTDNLKVTAYPNPFTNLVKFTIQSNISGQASLDVYNSVGQKVSTVYKGYLQANRGQVVEYRAPRIGSNLIYILRVGSKQVTGKLLRLE